MTIVIKNLNFNNIKILFIIPKKNVSKSNKSRYTRTSGSQRY